jgi:hypothetical protein
MLQNEVLHKYRSGHRRCGAFCACGAFNRLLMADTKTIILLTLSDNSCYSLVIKNNEFNETDVSMTC